MLQASNEKAAKTKFVREEKLAATDQLLLLESAETFLLRQYSVLLEASTCTHKPKHTVDPRRLDANQGGGGCLAIRMLYLLLARVGHDFHSYHVRGIATRSGNWLGLHTAHFVRPICL